METLQTLIVNAIKPKRSSERRSDELMVYKFVKKTPFNYNYGCKQHPENIN